MTGCNLGSFLGNAEILISAAHTKVREKERSFKIIIILTLIMLARIFPDSSVKLFPM